MIIKREPNKTTIEMEIDDMLITRIELLAGVWGIRTEKLISAAMEKVVEKSKSPLADKIESKLWSGEK